MSTRAQVLVIQEGLDWEQKIMLYHHCDGYPEGMLPLFKKAWKKFGGTWEAGRAGKAASFLCAADPGGFEPEAGFEIHGDVEYLYKLYVVNRQRGSLSERPAWELEILDPHNVVTRRTPLSKLIRLGDEED